MSERAWIKNIIHAAWTVRVDSACGYCHGIAHGRGWTQGGKNRNTRIRSRFVCMHFYQAITFQLENTENLLYYKVEA